MTFCPIWLMIEERTTYPIYCWGMVGFMVVIGLVYLLFQVMMVYSCKYIPATICGILLYVTVPCSYLLDFLFFGQKIGMMEIIGACIIVLTNITMGVLKGKGIIV